MNRHNTTLTCSDTALKRQEPSLAIGLRYKPCFARNSSIADSVKFPPLPFEMEVVPTGGPGFFFLFCTVVVGILTSALVALVVVGIA